MSILPPTYVRRTVKCSSCGEDFDTSVCIGGDPFSIFFPSPIFIALILLEKIFCPNSNKCSHCGKTYSKEEIFKILMTTSKTNN